MSKPRTIGSIKKKCLKVLNCLNINRATTFANVIERTGIEPAELTEIVDLLVSVGSIQTKEGAEVTL